MKEYNYNRKKWGLSYLKATTLVNLTYIPTQDNQKLTKVEGVTERSQELPMKLRK